jgi:hypothetical protein
MNPASQSGSILEVTSLFGLSTAHISGKAYNKVEVKPLLIENFIPTNLFTPSLSRCALQFIISIADLKSKK